MEKIIFTCETITPMFLAGADGQTPELRAPSIKGALRFWWRAVNGHLGLAELKHFEGQIFGDTKNRSKIIIKDIGYRHLSPNEITTKPMLPHKSGKDASVTPCFDSEANFEVHLSIPSSIHLRDTQNKSLLKKNEITGEQEPILFTLQSLKNLFIVTCLLGGLGKRSRRGFGAIKITSIQENDGAAIDYNAPTSIDDILTVIKAVQPEFVLNRGYRPPYPTLQNIQIANTYPSQEEALRSIITSSHEVKEEEYTRARERYDEDTTKTAKAKIEHYSNFESAIGDGGKRYASPIYVSLLPNGLTTIITELNPVPPRAGDAIRRQNQEQLRSDFIEKLTQE